MTKVTEREMLDRLNVRYGAMVRNGSWRGRKFTRAEHVPVGLSFQRSTIADYVAVSMHADTGTYGMVLDEETGKRHYRASHHVRPPVFHGHEVKVSRSDWLAELREPGKAEGFRPFMHGWWLVVSDKTIVRDDLPDGWGLMVSRGRSVRVLVPAPIVEAPEPMDPGMYGAILRATMTTELRIAGERDD
jgi:hypothetical protein